jgi:hypothetical protein
MNELDAALADALENPSDSDADISAFLDAPAKPDHDHLDAAIVGSLDAAPLRSSWRPSRPILDASSEALIMRLQDLQAPACFIKLLHRILHVCPVEQRVTHAEYFAGVKEVTAAHQRAGHVTASFELLDGHDESQNMLSNIGFVNACRISCGVIDGGASTSAPVCSSFVFMNSGTARRTFCSPLGDETVPSVAAANIMVARVLLLQWIFMSRMIFCVLEQPSSSMMEFHDQFQEFLRRFPLWRHSVNMGDFGADSQKSSWLYSSHACISHVDLFESTMLPPTKKKLATTGVNGVTGRKTINGTDDLKGSQAYTSQFAWALTQAYRQNSVDILHVAKTVACRTLRELQKNGPRKLQPMDANCQWWKAAKLEHVFAYMGIPS